MDHYVLRAKTFKEDDGRWSAWVPSLPGCATWGYSEKEALEALREATEAYLAIAPHEPSQMIDIASDGNRLLP